MKKLFLSTTVIVIGTFLTLHIAGCGGDNYTPAKQCECGAVFQGTVDGINVDNYKPDGTLGALINECDFERLYRGNNNNPFPAMYGETPALTKKQKGSYSYYTYSALTNAYTHLFDQYLDYKPFNSGDYMKDMREFSAFLANIVQETTGNTAPIFNQQTSALTQAGALGNSYGLYAVTEGSCVSTGCIQYGTKKSYCENDYPVACQGAADKSFCQLAAGFCQGSYPDGNLPDNQYFGRGGKQLSYAYNYMYYGSKIYPDDKYKIGNTPSLLDNNGMLGWETALAYWAIPYEDVWSTKPSMHEGFFAPTDVPGRTDFNQQVGFGKTVNIINGGVECGKSKQYVQRQTLNRINAYVELLFLNFGRIPIDRIEVTREENGATVVDTYTKEQLLFNISTMGVNIDGYAYKVTPSVDAPNLLKKLTRNGAEVTVRYNDVQPPWAGVYDPDQGLYGRYNSQPLIQEYYPVDSNKYDTTLTKVMLYYDADSSYNSEGITSERLDCTGIENFAGN